MRYFVLYLTTALIVTLGAFTAQAESKSTNAIPVSASVGSVLSLTANITRWSGDKKETEGLTEMAFGALTRPEKDYALYAAKYFRVYLGANTSSRPYKVTFIGTPLTRTGGTETIPNGAYTVNPVWAGVGGTNADIEGDKLGTAASAVQATDYLLYTSDSSGKAAVVEVIFAIPPRKSDGSFTPGQTADVPPDQKGGTYTGTVTFTLTI